VTVRTRIAPSPTGDPHVGTAYIALFNYCFAKKHGGQFLLRIEDTDQVRSTRESEEMILKSLRWAGLSWDEGPDVGGPCGPYRQSERAEIYQAHVQILLERGHAFRCFATAEELAEMRRSQSGGQRGYDGRYANLSAEEVQRRLDEGQPYVVRMRVPEDGICVIHDLLRGNIEIPWSEVDMQVLMKSDGLPTYHLANVVDDHLMGITHVLRGEEWISSAPKHKLLYEYFGWEMPVLCHLPLLRNPDKSKLSKRKNPTSILYYQRMGYLPEALLNFLGRMAWSMPEDPDQEIFSLDEMLANFDISRVSLGGPIFDIPKLDWVNGMWLRDRMDDEGFGRAVAAWALNEAYLKPIIPLIRQRVKKFSDLGSMTAMFFSGLLEVTPAHFEGVKKLSNEELRKALFWVMARLEREPAWTSEAIAGVLGATAELMGVKPRDFNKAFFVAISGGEVAPPLYQSMEHLGRDISRARLRHALEVLGGASKKEAERWGKELEAALGASSAPAEE
jgi:glutamyl-tRNA synthetase